jgi:uracil-DNA glycosylase
MNKQAIVDWHDSLLLEIKKPYFKDLETRVDHAYKSTVVFPPENQIFESFVRSPFHEIRVVILGQDPYHGPGQANGLAFSVNHGIATPPSLRNIFKELEKEGISSSLIDGNLEYWADQGVFLLNNVLTVEGGKADSHKGFGWQNFTDKVIATLSESRDGIVFLLWGGKAQSKKSLIDASKHHILCSGHPSPLSANRGYWFDNEHFIKTNEILQNQGHPIINW